ncbi:MAG: DNA-directed RNA polymerase subunit beta' [Clostridia bacterium]|nr:DNA-directed RNA polymerase subunit beta' [Clostridia bacterium]
MEKNEFASIKIGLASPEMIREWSYGEVTKPETINYRTLKAEVGGLFCERIFGPTKDGACMCGKYKNSHNLREKIICDKCGVEVTTKKVRRERMGHIELASPVSHIWYFKASPSRMALVLDIGTKQLEKVLYFAENIVIDPGTTPLEKGMVLSEMQYNEYREMYENEFRVGMGAEAIKELLREIDVEALAAELKEELKNTTTQKKSHIIKRLEVIESFRRSGNKLEWMILDVIPVLPPDIRPMVQLDGGRFASSDLNELYRRVISRNNRLKKLIEMRTPEIVIRNEKRMLQEAVDALIDNGRRGNPVTGPSKRQLKSLSEMLRGKQGRFRQNLLGKRVDYSGRSVIVVGPSLKIYQCGLPKEMALELFKPFVVKRLVEMGKAANVKEAQKKIDRAQSSNDEVWDAIETVIKEHPVLLNRAPTLHRLSIQAFEPVLVEGRAIKLHPLVCTAFNADFDGDQMPVHVPLSAEAQAEARFLMLSANNLLKPADGRAVTVPTQDMILGSYYLTIVRTDEKGCGKIYRNFDEAEMAYANGTLGLHAPIAIRIKKTDEDGTERTVMIGLKHLDAPDEEGRTLVVDTGSGAVTLGRLIFNKNIPQDLDLIDRSIPENRDALEITKIVTKKELGQIINACIRKHSPARTAIMLDAIKEMGYKYSTRASFSISVYDMTIPKEKKEIVSAAEAEVAKLGKQFNRGLLSEQERYEQVVEVWRRTTDDVTKALQAGFSTYNPIKIMSDSGARGSITQMRQLAGMRGPMFATNGKTMEIPIKSNFREGMKIFEYFMGARSSRKSLSDTALRTADSGYLTRRLVDVSQDVIVREEKCDTKKGAWVTAIMGEDSGNPVETLEDRLLGRFTIDDIVDPKTGEVIVPDDTMLTQDLIKKIVAAGIERVHIRTVIQCHARHGVCAHCYGADLATGKKVNVGEAVGIIAAQSIGEPGTQLTMRTFHSGGVAGSDITQGLPRVEELFEARTPKKPAILSAVDGIAHIQPDENPNIQDVVIQSEELGETTKYQIPYGRRIIVEEGAQVKRGDALTEGSKAPMDIMNYLGTDAVYNYIIAEVQRVYRSQSVNINDKHIEVIARQMTRKLRIEESGDTTLLQGSVVSVNEFEDENNAIRARIAAGETDLHEATASQVLLGISKAALQTDSFLSAASFQETTKVLTDAAIKGKIDNLLGLKENVIIGKLIPAGTGMECYNSVGVIEGNQDKAHEGNKNIDPEDLAPDAEKNGAGIGA